MGVVVRLVISRFAVAAAKLATCVMRAQRAACRPSGVAGGLVTDLTRSRAELIAENALLRQQLMLGGLHHDYRAAA